MFLDLCVEQGIYIPWSEIHKSFQEKWSQSNDAILEDYGPEITYEDQQEICNNYTEDIDKDEIEEVVLIWIQALDWMVYQ